MPESATIAAPEATSAPAVEVPAAARPETTVDDLAAAFRQKLRPTVAQDRSDDGKFKPKATAGDTSAASTKPAIVADAEIATAPAAEAGPKIEETPPEAEAAEEAPAEEDAEQQESETEAEATGSPIDAPAWWSAEEKADFAAFSPRAKQIIAARETQREQFIQQEKTKLAEARAPIEAEKKATQTERQHLREAMQRYATPIIAEYKTQFADLLEGKITELQLASDDTIRYDADGKDRWSLYQGYQARFAALQRSAEHLKGEQQKAAEAEFKTFRDTETQKYRDKFKISDDTAWAKHNDELTAVGETLGFTTDELRYMDARHMETLRRMSAAEKKAALYDKAMAEKNAAVAKPQAKIVPKVVKPGVATRQPNAATQKVAAFASNFKSTGKVEDLARLFGAARR